MSSSSFIHSLPQGTLIWVIVYQAELPFSAEEEEGKVESSPLTHIPPCSLEVRTKFPASHAKVASEEGDSDPLVLATMTAR